jgi:hypothetical protein
VVRQVDLGCTQVVGVDVEDRIDAVMTVPPVSFGHAVQLAVAVLIRELGAVMEID